jgi:hypothetical protein
MAVIFCDVTPCGLVNLSLGHLKKETTDPSETLFPVFQTEGPKF